MGKINCRLQCLILKLEWLRKCTECTGSEAFTALSNNYGNRNGNIDFLTIHSSLGRCTQQIRENNNEQTIHLKNMVNDTSLHYLVFKEWMTETSSMTSLLIETMVVCFITHFVKWMTETHSIIYLVRRHDVVHNTLLNECIVHNSTLFRLNCDPSDDSGKNIQLGDV